ncbi:unnamed protein product [Sympodiomycopsis kandeliae]
MIGSHFLKVVTTILLLRVSGSWADSKPKPPNKWCGKCYEVANLKNPECALPADSFFNAKYPPANDAAIFSCNPRFSGYLPEELSKSVEIILDAGELGGNHKDRASTSKRIVKIYDASGRVLATEEIGYPSRGNILKVPGTKLVGGEGVQDSQNGDNEARQVKYKCTLQGGDGQKAIHGKGTFDLLPEREKGSIVTVDYLSGALRARKVGKQGYDHTFFPFGFYTSWDWIQGQNLDIVMKQMKEDGLTMIHPVPDYGRIADADPAAIANVTKFLDAAERNGLWVAYDLRSSYKNDSSVAFQVNAVKYHPALLTVYTADEPDQGDPLDATTNAYNLVRQPALDGGAHPVSLVLNCEDYYYDRYARGAEIIAQDAYPVSVNTTFSRRWNTTCTLEYGDCGCDMCSGTNNLSDSTVRNQVYQQRLRIMEAEQQVSKSLPGAPVKGRAPIWAVLQGFGAPEEYWPRGPTLDEFVVMAIGGFARGASGIMPWQYSIATDEIRRSAAQKTAHFIHLVSRHVLWDKNTTSHRLDGLDVKAEPGVDVGGWKISNGQILLLLANPGNGDAGGYRAQSFWVKDLNLPNDTKITRLVDTHPGEGSFRLEDGVFKVNLGPLQGVAILLGEHTQK